MTPIDSDPPLQTIDQRERLVLAPYAMFSRASQGRRYAEPEHPYRGPFQRDRDRIVHSAAFRRLSGKMQVFTGEMGDYHRTRLTHTQEVASIARTMARALQLNEDLVEALALFHDIGHPPYGHAGEEVLDEWLSDEGGFSHNAHALTIAEELEHPYADFPGLNLTHEVLASQRTRVDKSTSSPSLLEAQLVDLADSIAYDAHDTDDALKLDIVALHQLRDLAFTGSILEELAEQTVERPPSAIRRMLVRRMIDRSVTVTLKASARRLSELKPESSQEVLDRHVRLQWPEEDRVAKVELEQFLYHHVYRHPALQAVRQAGQQRMKKLLAFLLEHPEHLPERFVRRSRQVGHRRAAAEFVAGMTERFLERTCGGLGVGG